MDDDIPPCSDAELAELTALIGRDEARGMQRLDTLLKSYQDDARLHFLRGSLLAGQRDYDAARGAMRRAVALAPHFSIARFQLGLLLLTSGEPSAAQEVWGPLHGLGASEPLACFVRGMDHLIRDEFDPAIGALEEGIARNSDNPPLNRDMRMLIDALRRCPPVPDEGGPASAADQLLRQAALKATKH